MMGFRKKVNNQRKRLLVKSGAGFSMLEILVSLSILAILMAVVISNYRRGNDDSVLSREISLLASRIRLAQEQTTGGTTGKYCENPNYGKTCTIDSDCAGPAICHAADTPIGGYAVAFNCNPQYQWGLNYPVIGDAVQANTTPYFLFGDRISCDTNCFSGSNNGWTYGTSDGLITMISPTVGDTLVNTYQIDNKLVFKDLQITALNLEKYYCSSSLPWGGQPVTGHDTVPVDYPLRATIRFKPPDGRQIEITNGVSTQMPGGNPWKQVEIMFGLKNRNTDCRVVIFTKEGVMGQYVDSNCSFAT